MSCIENVILEILCIAFIYAIFHKGNILLNFENEKMVKWWFQSLVFDV